MPRPLSILGFLLLLLSLSIRAQEPPPRAIPDRGEGALEVDGEPTYLDHARAWSVAGSFDPAEREILVLLSEQPWPEPATEKETKAPDTREADARDAETIARRVRESGLVAVLARLSAAGVIEGTLFHSAWENPVPLTPLDLLGGLGQGQEGRAFGRIRAVEGSRHVDHTWFLDLSFDARLRKIP